MSFTCANCSKVCKNKGGLTNHLKKCQPVENKQANAEPVEVKQLEAVEVKQVETQARAVETQATEAENKQNEENKQNVENKQPAPVENNYVNTVMHLVDTLHNVLREKGIIGAHAYHDINKLLFLRFMQPYLKTTLSSLIDDNKYKDMDNYERYIPYLKYISDLESLQNLQAKDNTDINQDQNEIHHAIYGIWKLLNHNELTRPIFESGKTFSANAYQIKKCLQYINLELKQCNFDSINEDIKGMIYEHFINKYASSGGKELGQFFTPRPLIKIIMDINKDLYNLDDLKIGSIYDPCMGTAGFLLEGYKSFRANSPDVELYGNELQPQTYVSAIMNILLATGKLHKLKCKDTFNDNTFNKYDIILTNPPFGLKGLKYENIARGFEGKTNEIIRGQGVSEKKGYTKEELYPVKTNSAEALFLQHCISKLNDNGICSIVLPNGKIFTSKEFIKLRKHLLEKCNVHAILKVPAHAFMHAGVSTAIIFFSKRGETSTVKFYDLSDDLLCYKLLLEVPIASIKENNYSLNYAHYTEKRQLVARAGIEIKKLGDVLIRGSNGKTNSGSITNTGEYPFYAACSINPIGTNKSYDFDDENDYLLFIKSGGNSKTLFGNSLGIGKFFLTKGKTAANVAVIKFNVNSKYNIKYIYYYLSSILFEIQKMATYTTGNGNIDINEMLKLQIPVPDVAT